MRNVWREYGIIAVLLVVAVGGYLLLSRSEEDVLGRVMDSFSTQLLALVPDAQARQSTEASLAEFRARVESGDVQPEQLEQFAASVLNLQASGSHLDHDEAQMVIKMAMEAPDALPVAVSRAPESPQIAQKPSRAQLATVARHLDEMAQLYSEVSSVEPPGESQATAPTLRFYSDNGLRVVVDERLRQHVSDKVGASDRMAWQPRLTETVLAERKRRIAEAEVLSRMVLSAGDSLGHLAEMRSLATLRRLEAQGFITSAQMDSLAREMQERFGRALQEQVEAAVSRAMSGVGESAAIIVEEVVEAAAAAASGASNRP